MKTRVFNLIILDESGSMCSIEHEALTGVNETLQTIRAAQRKHEDQEQFVSFVAFNSSHVRTLLDCVPALESKDIAASDYNPNSCTPLYDAMGSSLNALRRRVAPEDHVLVTIITDGYENDSTEFNHQSIRALVEELKAAGWVFAYIGAEHDVESVASSLSITNTLVFHRNAESTRHMSQKLARCSEALYERIACCREAPDERIACCRKAPNLQENFFDEKS